MMFPFARLRGEYAQSAELAFLRHELAQPLTYLSTSLGILRRRLDATKTNDALSQRAIAAAEEAVAHLAELVRRIGADDLKDGVGPVDLSQLVEAAVLMVEEELSVHAQLTVDTTTGVVVQGSRTRLTQVLLNLLTNAALALVERGEERGHIAVRVTTRTDGHAVLMVHDDGIGIAAQDQARIGELHFTTRPGRGSGFGLAVCRGIIDAYGGTLTLRSERGGGTTATVTLPAIRG